MRRVAPKCAGIAPCHRDISFLIYLARAARFPRSRQGLQVVMGHPRFEAIGKRRLEPLHPRDEIPGGRFHG